LWGHTGQSAEYHFQTLANILLGHYILTYGGDRQSLKISDLFTFKFASKGPTQYIPLITITQAGKQNQHSYLETTGALQSRDPLIYVLGAVAFYLLYRWDLTDKPFPCFKSQA